MSSIGVTRYRPRAVGPGVRPAGTRILLAGGGYGAAPQLPVPGRPAPSPPEWVGVHPSARATTCCWQRASQRCQRRCASATEDGSRGIRGLITAAVEAEITAQPPDAVYACRPVRMLEAIDLLCEARHVPRQLSWEAHMRCGIGLCGRCELPDPHHRTDPCPACRTLAGWRAWMGRCRSPAISNERRDSSSGLRSSTGTVASSAG